METTSSTYNGWTNYATWGVALVLDNDRGTYEAVREMAAESKASAMAKSEERGSHYAALDLADRLKDFTEELCGLEGDEYGAPEPSLMAKQVIQAGLAEVNWDEIARNILSEEI